MVIDLPFVVCQLKPKESLPKKEEKREATQRKSVRELANKFKDGMPMPGAQGSVMLKKKGTAISCGKCVHHCQPVPKGCSTEWDSWGKNSV